MPKILAKLTWGNPNRGDKCRRGRLNAGAVVKIGDFRREALSTQFGRKYITLFAVRTP